jgi:hypothetical protein
MDRRGTFGVFVGALDRDRLIRHDVIVTVCIAAMCRDDEGATPRAVVAADRMVTLGGFMEFEHTVPKMDQPADSALVLIAGDTLYGTRLASDTGSSLRGTNPRTGDLALKLAVAYEQTRQEVMAQQVLAPRGLSLSEFYDMHAKLNPNVTMMIDQLLSGFNLGVELLVAGVDDQGAHIYSIENPGRPERRHDPIGYGAIGSGTPHALQAMIGFRHCETDSFKDTLFRVYVAKRRSEVAPGVGLDTDMAVISRGEVSWLSDETIAQLAHVYESFQDNTTSALRKELEDLVLDKAEGNDHVAS